MSASWFVMLGQASSSSALLVGVLNGTATLLYTALGSQCFFYATISTAGLIDSPEAVNITDANGGAAFLAAHPGVSKTFAVLGVNQSSPMMFGDQWHVAYTTCASTQSSGTGYEFDTTISATSGELISVLNDSVSCSGGPQASTSIAQDVLGGGGTEPRLPVSGPEVSAQSQLESGGNSLPT